MASRNSGRRNSPARMHDDRGQEALGMRGQKLGDDDPAE
jgi:hypothetical protein